MNEVLRVPCASDDAEADRIIQAVEKALAAVDVKDEDSFRAALRLLESEPEEGELVYEDFADD